MKRRGGGGGVHLSFKEGVCVLMEYRTAIFVPEGRRINAGRRGGGCRNCRCRIPAGEGIYLFNGRVGQQLQGFGGLNDMISVAPPPSPPSLPHLNTGMVVGSEAHVF